MLGEAMIGVSTDTKHDAHLMKQFDDMMIEMLRQPESLSTSPSKQSES